MKAPQPETEIIMVYGVLPFTHVWCVRFYHYFRSMGEESKTVKDADIETCSNLIESVAGNLQPCTPVA